MNNKLLELSMNNLADEDGDILHIPHGDMPGDKINIEKSHIEKAKVIFPELIKSKRMCNNKFKSGNNSLWRFWCWKI